MCTIKYITPFDKLALTQFLAKKMVRRYCVSRVSQPTVELGEHTDAHPGDNEAAMSKTLPSSPRVRKAFCAYPRPGLDRPQSSSLEHDWAKGSFLCPADI